MTKKNIVSVSEPFKLNQKGGPVTVRTVAKGVRREQIDIDKLVQGLLLLVEQRSHELVAELRNKVKNSD